MQQLISIVDAAKILDVDVKTVRNWISQGRLAAVRIGPKLVKLRVKDLEEMIKPVPAATNGGDRA